MMPPRSPGRIKVHPEDFVVEELPAYAPTGTGEHVFVRFTKTDLTTLDAVRALARATGTDAREAGFAGMKDRRAVTTQTISLHAPRGVAPADLVERARVASVDGVVVREAIAHGHKMKPGHLAGNRFTIVVRDVPRDRLEGVSKALDRMAKEGVPNAFGAQRFGRAGDNAARALAWLRGTGPGPRDSRVQRLLWSSLQSAVFNAVLEARVKDSTWATALEGDLLKLRSSGGLFLCSDVQADRERAATGEVSPTGPIVGTKMRPAEGTPGELERRMTDAVLGADFDLERTRRLGEGTRRPMRIWIEELRWTSLEGADVSASQMQPGCVYPERELRSSQMTEVDQGQAGASIRVHFVLPKGAYATTVLGGAFELGESHEGDGPPEDS
jgi:tRNA pseudouridine13 synthase